MAQRSNSCATLPSMHATSSLHPTNRNQSTSATSSAARLVVQSNAIALSSSPTTKAPGHAKASDGSPMFRLPRKELETLHRVSLAFRSIHLRSSLSPTEEFPINESTLSAET